MSFPLFDPKKLEERSSLQRPASAPTDGAAKAAERDAASCPAEPAKPLAYLRDVAGIALVLLALAGALALAYYAPRWL